MSESKYVNVRTSDNGYFTIFKDRLLKSEYFKNMDEIDDGTELFFMHTFNEMVPIVDYLTNGLIVFNANYIGFPKEMKQFFDKFDKLLDYYLIPKIDYNGVYFEFNPSNSFNNVSIGFKMKSQ